MLSTVDGLSIAHASSGSGSPVVLLHGWGATGAAMSGIALALAPDHACHTLDLPGFGDSPPPPEPRGVRDYAHLVIHWLAALGIARASFIGHSFGGRISIVLGAEHPTLVDRLILVDSAGIRPTPSTWRGIALALARAGQSLPVPGFLGPVQARARDAVRGRLASDDDQQAGALRPTFRKVISEDLRPLLPSIHAPTLLVWGELDTVTPVADAHIMEREIPDAGLVILPGAGHFSYLDCPDRFATIARVFLAEDQPA